MSEASIALVTLGAVIVLFAVNRLPVGVVALGASLSLWATGLLDIDQALRGFGDPVVVFIASLFVVSEAIDATGITTWAGQRVIALAGDRGPRILLALMALCAVLTALISLNGSVAALLPMVVMLALRLRVPPSRLLMPMVYAGSAGSLLVLMGSPVNVIMSDASRDAGEGPFGFFEFAIVGGPILLVTMGLGAVLAPRLLPDRHPISAPPDLSRHAALLGEQYDLSGGVYRLRVRATSSLLGRSRASLTPEELGGVRLVAVQALDGTTRLPDDPMDEGDVLVVTGQAEEATRLAVDSCLAVAMRPIDPGRPDSLVDREAGVAEVVVPPRSPLVGEEVYPGMHRANDLVILAIQRHGRDQGERSTELAAGDCLVVFGAWPALDALVDDRSVLVVDSPELMRRQSVPLGRKAGLAGAVTLAMVALLASGAVPAAVAGLLAVLALVLTKVLTSPQAYRAVSWETIVLVGGLIPLSDAIQASGAAADIADVILALVGDRGPVVLMAALFALTSILGLVISNTATALIVLPVALSAAHETGISVRPVLMLVAIAGSAALLTPIQTPGNMMIAAPAGYRFSDYARLGLPLLLAWLAVALVVIPLVWGF